MAMRSSNKGGGSSNDKFGLKMEMNEAPKLQLEVTDMLASLKRLFSESAY